MGKLAFLFLALFVVVSPGLGFAADYDPTIEGCKYFCRAQHPLVEGGRDTGYDNCIVQTQAEGKCGGSGGSAKKSTQLPTVGPIPEARPDNGASASTCKKDYDKYYNACQATTGEAESTCDEDNNQELKNAMNSTQNANSAGQSGSVQYACGQASNLSQSAKNAMTSYKNNCSGALTSCRDACAEFALFMNENKCWSELGYNQQSSKTVVDSMMKACESQQAKVDDAEKAIANYSNTNASSNACQGAASGMSMPQEAKAANAEAKTFCQMNPNTPGCGSTTLANCDDPSQSSNKVCVCSRNPRDPMCLGTQSAERSSNDPSIDSSSRLPTNEANLTGDIPSVPDIMPGKVGSSGDVQGIDGRQNTTALGGGGAGSGSPSNSGNGRGGAPADDPALGAGSYGGGGGRGAGFGGAGSSGGGSGSGYGRPGVDGGSADAKGGPDLRQFLPGGVQDPRKMNGNAGSLEKDGVTGPHSSNWRKIQNRYQILKTTLEP